MNTLVHWLERKGVDVQQKERNLLFTGPDLHEFRTPADVVERQAKKLKLKIERRKDELVVSEDERKIALLALKDDRVTSATCFISEYESLGGDKSERRERIFKFFLWAVMPKQLRAAQLITTEKLAVKLTDAGESGKNLEIRFVPGSAAPKSQMLPLFEEEQPAKQQPVEVQVHEFRVPASRVRRRGGSNESTVLIRLENNTAVSATIPVDAMFREHAEVLAKKLGDALRNGHSLDQLRKAFGKTRQMS